MNYTIILHVKLENSFFQRGSVIVWKRKPEGFLFLEGASRASPTSVLGDFTVTTDTCSYTGNGGGFDVSSARSQMLCRAFFRQVVS